MPDEQTAHPDYIKGFNEGYEISKALPELSDKIAVAMGESDRANGFKDGRKELLQEKLKDKVPAWADKSHKHYSEPEKSKERDDKERE